MKKRPIGVTILSILCFVGGIGLITVLLFFGSGLSEASGVIGVSGTAMNLNMWILALWALTAGAGQWIGKKWGWWLGATYISYSVLRNANALLTISDIAATYEVESSELVRYYIKHIGRVVFHSLIAIYYFKKNVLEYFGFCTEKKWKRILSFLGVSVVIFVVMSVLTMVA